MSNGGGRAVRAQKRGGGIVVDFDDKLVYMGVVVSQNNTYANITNPATSWKKTLTQAKLVKLIKATVKQESQQMVDDGEYDNVTDAARDTWVSNYEDTYSVSMESVYRKVASSILSMNDDDMNIVQEIMVGMSIRDYESAEAFYNNILTPTTGIDGYWTTWKNPNGGEDHNIILAFNSNQIKDASPVTYDDAGNVIPLSERFDQTQQDIRYSHRENDHLLSKSEYTRFMSNWNSQKYGNQFEPRPNGGKMIVMDNIIVYTDRKGNVERVLEVTTGDIWKLNDIQQTMMILEEDGVDHEIQQIVLHSVYDTESAHFRTGGERSSIGRQNRKGTGRNARSVGKGDSGEVSSQKERGTLASVNHKAQAKFALRDQTDTPEFQRWFKDSEVVDSDGNPKIVYHATDATFTVFDRDKLGSNTRTNTDSEAAARSAEVGFWFSDRDRCNHSEESAR